jgi:hypothetical protein
VPHILVLEVKTHLDLVAGWTRWMHRPCVCKELRLTELKFLLD